MAEHVVITDALNAAATAYLGSETPQSLPVSKVELATLSTKRVPTAADATLVNGVIPTDGTLDFTGNTEKGIFHASGNTVIDITDARVDQSTGAIYAGIDAIGVYFDPPGAQAEFLGIIIVEDAATGVQLPLSKARTSELTFAVGLSVSGHQLSNATFTLQADPYATDAEMLTGTARNRHANPAGVKHAIDGNVFPDTVVTATDRDLDNYTTPGNFLLDHPSNLSWQNLPSGVSVDTPIFLEVRQYGGGDKFLTQTLVVRPSSAGDALLYWRSSRALSNSRGWSDWQALDAQGVPHVAQTAAPTSTQITNAEAGTVWLVYTA